MTVIQILPWHFGKLEHRVSGIETHLPEARHLADLSSQCPKSLSGIETTKFPISFTSVSALVVMLIANEVFFYRYLVYQLSQNFLIKD
jgi:hypothetical protein